MAKIFVFPEPEPEPEPEPVSLFPKPFSVTSICSIVFKFCMRLLLAIPWGQFFCFFEFRKNDRVLAFWKLPKVWKFLKLRFIYFLLTKWIQILHTSSSDHSLGNICFCLFEFRKNGRVMAFWKLLKVWKFLKLRFIYFLLTKWIQILHTSSSDNSPGTIFWFLGISKKWPATYGILKAP